MRLWHKLRMAPLPPCICRIFDSSGRLVAVSHHLGAFEHAVPCCAVLFPDFQCLERSTCQHVLRSLLTLPVAT